MPDFMIGKSFDIIWKVTLLSKSGKVISPRV